MAWPDYVKPSETYSARDYLDWITNICQGRLAVFPWAPPSPVSAYYQHILTSAIKDRDNEEHHSLRTKVTEDGSAPEGATLDDPWLDVKGCYDLVSLANPTIGQLSSAIEGIDHTGGGGGDALPPPEPMTARQVWPDHAPKGQEVTARVYLASVMAFALGRLQGAEPNPRERRLLEQVLLEAQLDTHNVPHGSLRARVKADGQGKTKSGLDAAWTSAQAAFQALRGPAPRAADLSRALQSLRHLAASASAARSATAKRGKSRGKGPGAGPAKPRGGARR